MNNSSKMIVNEFIRILPQEFKGKMPQEFKGKIDVVYSERTNKLIQYLMTETDPNVKKEVLAKVIKTYNNTVGKSNEAIMKLLRIYKRRELSDIGLAGLNTEFKYIVGKDVKDWPDSFKYWQIFAILVQELLNKQVDLKILKSVNGLSRYRTQPFVRVHIHNQQKRGKKRPKGKPGQKRGPEQISK